MSSLSTLVVITNPQAQKLRTSPMQPRPELVEKVETFQNMLISYSTGGSEDEEEFRRLRQDLLLEPMVKDKLPRFVRTHKDFKQFWVFIEQQSPRYQGRREFLWAAFRPLLEFLETAGSPADQPVSEVLAKFDTEHVHSVWARALERRTSDPEGAITSARTLLETVCKHVLDKCGAVYDEDADLPKLYRLTAEMLNLAPSQQTEQIFKQVFGGCQTVVEGLGALRNKLSDAHGKGSMLAKPEPRHAELAVNLAGTMATFLISTWEKESPKEAGKSPLAI